MTLTELYDLIRKEPVLLWIGSGFSLDAGLPSAAELINLLYTSLSDSEKVNMDVNKGLAAFADDFQALKGREIMTFLIQERFRQAPATTFVHELLARISYFRSIVTTNYDKLLENAYPPKIAVIKSDTDIFATRLAKTKLYKVHGDIDDGKSMVLTSMDYSNMYNRNFKDPFWASLISALSSHHIIFLGYGYEDENIWSDFNHIEEKLKDVARKKFFISPGIKHIKALKLEQSGITFISASGEAFVTGLVEHLKNHIISDNKNGLVDSQTTQDFVTAFDLRMKIESTKESTAIIALEKISGATQHSINFSFDDSELIEKYKHFSENYVTQEFEINQSQVTDFAFVIEGFKFKGKEEFAEIKLMHQSQRGKLNLSFPKNVLTLYGATFEFFNSIPGKILIKFSYHGFTIEFNISNPSDSSLTVNFRVKEPELIPEKHIYKKFFHALYLFFSGKNFAINRKGLPATYHQFQPQENAHQFKKLMDTYLALLKIEKEFQIKLPSVSINAISDEDKQTISKLAFLIDMHYYAIKEPNGLSIIDMPHYYVFVEKLKDLPSGTYLTIESKEERSVELFGIKIMLGREQISMINPMIIASNEENHMVTLLPNDQVLLYHYEKFGFF